MLGNLDYSNKQATVVGGGISGLLLSYQLMKAGFQVQLIEKQERLGGLLHTTQTPFGLAESAAHSLLLTDEVEAFLRALSLQWSELNPNFKARYIFKSGKLRRMPLGLVSLLGLLWRIFFRKAKSTPVANLEQWGRYFLGDEATQYLLAPALLGIYAATPAELAVEAVFPQLQIQPGQTLFSRLRAMKKTWKKKRIIALTGGMQSLVSALERELRASPLVSVKTSTSFSVNEHLNSPNLALCVPAPEVAKILSQIDAPTSAAFSKIQYVPLWSTTLFFNKKDFENLPPGIGVLFPPKEQQEVLGILFNSNAFEGRTKYGDQISITCLLGGTLRPRLITEQKEAIQKAILACLKQVFGVDQAPLHVVHHAWPQAIPLYNREILQAVVTAKERWCSKRGKLLFGNYVGSVSIRGMIESIAFIQFRN